jgi:hypothetical protein
MQNQNNKMHDLIMLVVTFCPLAGICLDQSSTGHITINGLLTLSGPEVDCTGTSQGAMVWYCSAEINLFLAMS